MLRASMGPDDIRDPRDDHVGKGPSLLLVSPPRGPRLWERARNFDLRPSGARINSPLSFLFVALLSLLLLGACVGNRFSPDAGWSGVADGGELVFVGSRDRQLLALDSEGGAIIWKFPIDKGDGGEVFGAIYGTPTLSDGLVYVGGYNGKVYIVDAESGSERAQFEVEGDEGSKGVIGAVVVSEGKAVFGAADDSESGRLYVLNADTGEEVCRYPSQGTIGKVWSTPAVADGIAYFGDLNHRLYAVSLEDCTLQWQAPVELGGAIASTPLVVGGRVYVGAFDRTFYAVETFTGAVTELFTAENWFWSGVATDGRHLFVPSLDGKLYAIDLATGNLLWEPFDTEGAILSSPVVVNGQVVVASDSEVLYVLSTRDGSEVFRFLIGAKVRAPLIAQGSVVYVSAMDHTIRAYDLDDLRQPLKWQQNTK